MAEARRSVLVLLLSVYSGGRDWPPDDPAGFMAWWQGKIDAIPEEYRATASIEIAGVCAYEDDRSGRIKITYSRPETDDEAAERASRERAAARETEARERAVFERLKAKFGTETPD